MKLEWHLHPEADAEYQSAAHYYALTGGLHIGEDFIDQIESAATRICEWPEAWPLWQYRQAPPTVRAFHLKGFSLTVIYTVLESRVFVLAFAHEKRRPGYWLHRLKGLTGP